MLDLEIIPERSLRCENYWEFILGMHFSQAVAIIQSQVAVIKGVQVLYSESDPLNVDVVINMPLDGVRLIFDSVVQRLKAIEVYNMKLVKLKYYGTPFNSPEVAPSIEQIEHSFGATHPGVYDAAKQMFALNFRGLSFYFPVKSKLQPNYAHGLSSLHFENGESPVVSKLTLYSGNNEAKCRPPPLPLSCYNQQTYADSTTILCGRNGTRGIRFNLYTEVKGRSLEACRRTFTRQVLFGDTCQDVTRNLGQPNRIFYKSDDKMKIHSPNANGRPLTKRSDFFFNYFTLGIDVLFDARTQRCRKIMLHTNFPGHYNFNMYHRCEFHMLLRAGDKSDENADRKELTLSSYSRWDTISNFLKPSIRPIVLHRAGAMNSANPFGSTFCYGYRDMIFEVLPNNHIASVTLFSNKSYPTIWADNNNCSNAHRVEIFQNHSENLDYNNARQLAIV